ncbi:hypothetical protein [Amycolatopsis samaneae]|uniref:Uncharacterized protein n=1 Tax=Amycolatopsis samaneae TaxID=664691 RepID=A0ABW5GNE1_9PSEU
MDKDRDESESEDKPNKHSVEDDKNPGKSSDDIDPSEYGKRK